MSSLPAFSGWRNLEYLQTMEKGVTSARHRGLLALLVAVVALVACSDADSSRDPTGEARAEALRGQAQNDQQRRQAEAVQELLGKFREGATLPTGWPADIVPIPDGAKPVASINRSELADGAFAMTMFYSSSRSPEAVQSAFESGLKDEGWSDIELTRRGDLYLVDAQRDNFNGIFMAGVLPSTPRLKSGETINVMIVLGTTE
jgi:hypothetical protein